MGKVGPTRYITREEDRLRSKSGPFSIITWRNLKPSSETEPREPKEPKAEK